MGKEIAVDLMRAWDDDSVNAKIVGVAFLLTTQRYHGRPPGPADSVQKVGGRYGAPPIAISVLPTPARFDDFLIRLLDSGPVLCASNSQAR